MLKTTDQKLRFFIFLLAFLVFANTIGHDYAWDDSIVITENPRVKKGFAGIPALFVKSNSAYKADKYGYRPVVLTSFAIEYALFKDKPAVGHFMNALYFALLCAVMYGVLRKVFFRFTNLGPFLICLLFAVHPIHVEAVANIKSRDEIFSLLFALLSLSRLIRYQAARQTGQLVVSLLLFLLAFLSKESAITFLLVMPLTLLYMQEKIDWKKLLKPLVYVCLLFVVCFAIVKLSASSSLGTALSKGAGIFHESGLQGNSFFYSYNPSEKLANALTVLGLYLKLFFYPVTLVYFYGYNQVPVASWSQPLVIASLLLHIAALAFALLKFKTQREVSYGILFYLITISVYTHLFRTLADTMADRFLFTPSLGLCVIVVFSLAALFKVDLRSLHLKYFITDKKKNSANLKYVLSAVLILLCMRTLSRNMVWRNNETLTSHDMPYLENCARAHNYYADILKNKLIAAYDPGTEAEMIRHYRRSIEISKEAYYSYVGLGTYLTFKQRYPESIAVFESMLRLYPNEADPHYYLGQVYNQTGRYAEAIPQLETSLRLAPEVLNTYYELSIAYSRSGQFEKALATINQAKQKYGESSYIYEALGHIYFDKGDLEQSTKYVLEMLRFGADPQKVYGVIIGRYQFKKQDSEAAFYYHQAVEKGIFRPGGR